MDRAAFIKIILGVLIGGGLGALMGYFGKCTSGACPLTANPYRGAIYGAVMGLFFAYSFGVTKINRGNSIPDSGAIVHINTSEDFQQLLSSSKLPILADFYSKNCSPCRRLSPVISALADEYVDRAVICKVSMDLAPDLAMPNNIKGIPAVLFFVDGKEVERLVGLRGKSDYIAVLEKLIK
jgi:thioredoxin 1